jgi:hypothetical protein
VYRKIIVIENRDPGGVGYKFLAFFFFEAGLLRLSGSKAEIE